MLRAIVFLGFLLPGFTALGQTDDTDELLGVLLAIESMSGDFQQTQYDEGGADIGRSSGQFKLLRPGYFSWEITAPDSQIIVAGPDYVWHHDRDLETVTQRPVDDSEALSPLQVLGGNEDVLRSNFTVEKTGDARFLLTPKGINPGFQSLSVSFAGKAFSELDLTDNLNQQVLIHFENLDTETALKVEDFAFTPPPDADVFYHNE